MDQLMQFISASITDMTRGDGLDSRSFSTTNPSSSSTSSTSTFSSSTSSSSSSSSAKLYKCALLDDATTTSSATAAASAAAAAAAGAGTVGTGTGTATAAGHVCSSGKQEDNAKDIVQQSQVSSTRSPSVLANDIIGPLLLEALDGFLFMVDNMGKIQFISENVTQYLKYTKDDLIGNNIYNLVHCDDYNNFARSLDLLSKDSTQKSRTFSCRMNIKPPGEERDRCYDNMQITAILQPHPCDSDSDKSSRCLLACIARRIGCVEISTTSHGIEKFTTKQDLKGKILACDTSGGQKSGNHSYSKLIGENVQDFCHANDRQQLLKHHREVINNGSNTSGVYRFRLHENRYVFVQTKSKLFKNPMNGNPEFIMSTHSIVRECTTESELKGSASSCLMKAIIGNSGTKLSKDQVEMSTTHPMPLSVQPQSTISELDFLGGPRLDFDNIADESSFSDIPDLLPNMTRWTSLSNLSLDKDLTSCPGSPISSIPTLSPATSASRSPRTTSNMQHGWGAKEYRPPKQGRGRPRSSKKSTSDQPLSWMTSGSAAMGVNKLAVGHSSQTMPVNQFDPRSIRTSHNPRSVGNYQLPATSLADSWENLYSSPSSVEQLSMHLSKKQGFGEIGLIQQMRRLQKGSRQRSFSGSSDASSSLLDKFVPSIRTSNKNAHLLDLLMNDDDEDEEGNSYLCNSIVNHDGKQARSATSIKSEHNNSEIQSETNYSEPLPQPKKKKVPTATLR